MRKLLLLLLAGSLTVSAQQGPIVTQQLNSTYYVKQVAGFYPTIQSAVTKACTRTGATVNIPAGSAPADTIAAVTGGCTSVGIVDERAVPAVGYAWGSGHYNAVSTTIAPTGAVPGQYYNPWITINSAGQVTAIINADACGEALTLEGAWDNLTVYGPGNVVTSGGLYYRATATIGVGVGDPATHSPPWTLLPTFGAGACFEGPYIAGVSYGLNNIVTSGGVTYISLTEASSGTPADYPYRWAVIGGSSYPGVTSDGANGLAVTGTVAAGTSVSAPQHCIGSSCITAWPTGGGTPRMKYASSSGCALNSNIATGGGTDDTVCWQNALTALGAAGGGTFVVDGVSLISNVNQTTAQTTCLAIPSNTTLHFLPGSGLFLKNASNCVGIGNVNLTGNPAATFDTNMRIDGPGVLNFNEGNQSQWERANSNDAWTYCIWFGGFNGVTVSDITIQNCPTFNITLSNGKNFTIRNVTVHEATSHMFEDGIHMWGPLDNGFIDNFASNGGDDVLAFNTDEGVYIYAGTVPVLYGMNNAFDWGTTKSRFPWSGGNITNVTAQHTYFQSSANGVRLYGLPTAGGTSVIDSVTIRDSMGNLTWQNMNNSGAEIRRIHFDGWHVTGMSGIVVDSTVPSGLKEWLTGIDPDVAITQVHAPAYLANDYVPALTTATYLSTFFNESSSGTLAGTVPAICTAGTGCTWTRASGTDFAYQSGGGVATATPTDAVFTLVNTGQTNEVIRVNLATCSGANPAYCGLAVRYSSPGNYVSVNFYANAGGAVFVQMYEGVAGTYTPIGSQIVGPITGQYTITLSGISVSVVGPSGSASATTVNTGTFAGISMGGSGATAMKVTSLTAKSF